MENDGVDTADRGGDSGGGHGDDGPSISDDARDSLDGGASEHSRDDSDDGGSDRSDDTHSDPSGATDAGHDGDPHEPDGEEAEEEAVDPHEPTPAERAASQERMEAESRAAREAFEHRQASSGYEAEAYGLEADTSPTGVMDAEHDPGTTEAAPVDSPLVGNTPGADFLTGEPLTEAAQADILAESQATIEEVAVKLGEIDALVDADVVAAELAFVPETYRTPTGIPGISGSMETVFDPDAARAEAEATYADQRRAAEFHAQNALNNAALVAGADGLSQMRNATVMSMEAADFGPAEITEMTSEGVLGPEGYHRADAFARAADAWGSGGAQDPAYAGGTVYGPNPEYSTEVIAGNPLNGGNTRVAGNLDDIVGRLQDAGQPELAADMRLHAVTQLGDAIYAGETGAHGDVLSVVRDGEPVSDLGRMTQASLERTPEGQAALEQFQTLVDPTRLGAMNLRTGEPVDYFTELSPQRPGSTEQPMGGYPEVIRDTIGEHIDAAIDARGMAAIGLAAAFVVPDVTDLALAGALAGAARVSRFGDEIMGAFRGQGDGPADAVDDALDAYRRQAADLPPADELRPTGVVEQRRQTVLAGHPNAEILSNHRGPTGQIDHFAVRVDGQTWHIPPGRTLDDLPDVDPVGDMMQEFATDAAARWDRAPDFSDAELEAIEAAHAAGKHYLGNILSGQARGRWVETEVRDSMRAGGIPNNRPAQGLDFVDPQSGLQYDIMSGTASNIARHAVREGEEMFRMITF